MDTLNLLSDGILVKKHFVNSRLLTDLNSELDSFFAKPSISTPFGVTTLDFSVKRLISPTRIYSTNILELALSIFFMLIPKEEHQNYLICEIQINSEKNNPHPLAFHTDNCKGEIRAQIYLSGGGKNSGGFLYMRGTHLISLPIDHFLDNTTAEKFKEKIIDCSGLPGDLIAFDAAGFHGKHVCTLERRTILFTFYPRKNGPKETIDINTSCISKTVFDNLELFTPDLGSESPSGWPKNFKNQPQSIGQAISFKLKSLIWSSYTKLKVKLTKHNTEIF